jgi:hypothetical protein
MGAQHIKIIRPPSKRNQLLWLVKDDLITKDNGVYSIAAFPVNMIKCTQGKQVAWLTPGPKRNWHICLEELDAEATAGHSNQF